jgi:outer membrane immunogenic protein
MAFRHLFIFLLKRDASKLGVSAFLVGQQLTEKEISMKFSPALLLGAASLTLIANPAFAQEAIDEDWTGPYIGGSIGLAAQNNDRREGVVFDTNLDGSFDNNVNTLAGANAFLPGFCGGAANGRTPIEGCRGDKDGLEYNIRAGYDVQQGNIVYGFVLEGGKNESRDSVTAFSSTPASYTFTREIDYALQARARVGYAARGALFYATGGAAYAKIDNGFSTTNGLNSFSDNGSTKSWGYSYGGGAEVKVASNLSLGLEYLYTNYVDDDYRVSVGPGTATATNPFLLVNPAGTDMRRDDSDFDMHNIRLTASLRF